MDFVFKQNNLKQKKHVSNFEYTVLIKCNNKMLNNIQFNYFVKKIVFK